MPEHSSCSYGAACQQTPGYDAVEEKNDGTLERMISASPLTSQVFEHPGAWQEDITSKDGQVTIHIDASVEVPDVSAYSVVAITPMDPTNDDLKGMADVFFGGKNLYDYEANRTKSQIEAEILQREADIQSLKSSGTQHSSTYQYSPSEIPKEVAFIESQITLLKQEYVNALKVIIREESDMQFDVDQETGYRGISVADQQSGDHIDILGAYFNEWNIVGFYNYESRTYRREMISHELQATGVRSKNRARQRFAFETKKIRSLTLPIFSLFGISSPIIMY